MGSEVLKAMTVEDAIAHYKARGHDLTYFGIGLPSKSFDESHLAALQKRLREDGSVIYDVANWLSQFNRRAKIDNHHSSYGLKHVAEKALGFYVSNGSFIAAAYIAGFDSEIEEPNCWFNINGKEVKETLPDGVVAL